MTQYEATLVRGSWAFSYIIPKLVPRIAAELGEDPTKNPEGLIAKRAALDICTAHEQYCTGVNQQYDSTEACMDFIQYQRPFGEVWQMGLDTGTLCHPLCLLFGGSNGLPAGICRYMHKGMVRDDSPRLRWTPDVPGSDTL